MKKQIRLYLTPEAEAKLKAKAHELFQGRGSISRYIEKLSLEPVIFLDANAKALLEALKLNSG